MKKRKQKVDKVEEASAEEKQAAYAARNAKAEHDAAVETARQEFEAAKTTYLELVGEMQLSGGMDEELNERVEEAEARFNELQATYDALRAAPAPMEVEPERLPWQTEAQKRIQELQQTADRTEDQEEELEQLRGAGKKARADKLEEKKAAQALARVENKMANRQEAIDNPSRAEKLFARNEGEMLWWKTMGRHLSSQKADRAYEARLEVKAVAMRRGKPPTRPPVRRQIAWPVSADTPKDIIDRLNRDLENLGLAEVEAARVAHLEEEERLAPVREQLKLDDEVAAQEAKEAKINKAKAAKEKKGKQYAQELQEQAASQAGAVQQNAQEAKARRQELARQDREAQAQAQLPWGKRRA